MEKLDYKKAYKDLYLPKTSPMIIEVPRMFYVTVKGKGNPNEEGGEYQRAMQILYGISFTIKMSKLSKQSLDGYFDYVVPPLEGFWWMDGYEMPDFLHKDTFSWISMIRLPEFVNKEVFDWACTSYHEKHPEMDVSSTTYMEVEEGFCVQIMHKGSYDDEPASVEKMHSYIKEQGYVLDFHSKMITGQNRMHHEIYLCDPRKCKPENLKTVIRHPIKKQ
ncbi:GyrI-like domain-containing protein [Amedibacillus sp. YH-ame6]